MTSKHFFFLGTIMVMGLQGSGYHSREIESIDPIKHLSKPNELINIFFNSSGQKRFPFLMIKKLMGNKIELEKEVTRLKKDIETNAKRKAKQKDPTKAEKLKNIEKDLQKALVETEKQLKKLKYEALTPLQLQKSITNNPKVWEKMLFKLATEQQIKLPTEDEVDMVYKFIEFIESTNPEIVNNVNHELGLKALPILERTFWSDEDDSDDEDDYSYDDY